MSHKTAFLTVAIVGAIASVTLLILVKEPRLRESEELSGSCGRNARTRRISMIDGEELEEEIDNITMSDESFKQASLSTRIKVLTTQLK